MFFINMNLGYEKNQTQIHQHSTTN